MLCTPVLKVLPWSISSPKWQKQEHIFCFSVIHQSSQKVFQEIALESLENNIQHKIAGISIIFELRAETPEVDSKNAIYNMFCGGWSFTTCIPAITQGSRFIAISSVSMYLLKNVVVVYCHMFKLCCWMSGFSIKAETTLQFIARD